MDVIWYGEGELIERPSPLPHSLVKEEAMDYFANFSLHQYVLEGLPSPLPIHIQHSFVSRTRSIQADDVNSKQKHHSSPLLAPPPRRSWCHIKVIISLLLVF